MLSFTQLYQRIKDTGIGSLNIPTFGRHTIFNSDSNSDSDSDSDDNKEEYHNIKIRYEKKYEKLHKKYKELLSKYKTLNKKYKQCKQANNQIKSDKVLNITTIIQ